MESLHYYVASRFFITLPLFLFIAHPLHGTMATNNTNNLSSDVTMVSLMLEIWTLKADLTALKCRRGSTTSCWTTAAGRDRTTPTPRHLGPKTPR